jgi:hypothetical protein
VRAACKILCYSQQAFAYAHLQYGHTFNKETVQLMAKYKAKLRAGVGAKASIFTRFLYPALEVTDEKHRSKVELVGVENVDIRGKEKSCFVCKVEGSNSLFYAPKTRFKLEANGPPEQFFVPLTQTEKDEEKEKLASSEFIEPKVKWEKSHAKKILYNMIMEGSIPDEDDESEDLERIYIMHEEFSKYDYFKFKDRLSRLRKKIQDLNRRADDDWEAYQVYISNHKPAIFSSKGYIQWQGSTAQEMLWEDMEAGKHKTMTPKELWLSREDVYVKEFPLDAFRSKLQQEIRTAKYLHTLEVREKAKKK